MGTHLWSLKSNLQNFNLLILHTVSRYSTSVKIKMATENIKLNQGFNARKCSASGRLIAAKDHAAIQINVAEVDEQGRITGSNITYAICGDLRRMGESDDALNRLCRESNIIPSDKFPAV